MQSKIKEIDLWTHPFSERILEDIHPLITDSLRSIKPEEFRPGFIDFASIQEPYLYFSQVAYTTSNLINTVERLRDIQIHLRIFPNRRNYEKYGITRNKWILYHYANFCVNIVSIYDIALILTNDVFRLGLPESKCKADVITGNAHLTNTRAKKILVKLEQHTKPYREPRHRHVHRGQVPTLPEIMDLGLITYLQKGSSKERIVSTKILNKLYSEASKNIVKNVGISRKNCSNIIYSLFDSLLPFYESQVKLLPPSKYQNKK